METIVAVCIFHVSLKSVPFSERIEIKGLKKNQSKYLQYTVDEQLQHM